MGRDIDTGWLASALLCAVTFCAQPVVSSSVPGGVGGQVQSGSDVPVVGDVCVSSHL